MCFAEEFISLSFVLVSYSYNFLVICHKILNRILVAAVHLGFILHPFLERYYNRIMVSPVEFISLLFFLVGYSYSFIVICHGNLNIFK